MHGIALPLGIFFLIFFCTYNCYKWLAPSLLLILQTNALRYRVCPFQVNHVSQISHAYHVRSPCVMPPKGPSAINRAAYHKIHATTFSQMELEQLTCVSGSSKSWFNRSPFALTGIGLVFQRSRSKRSYQREFLGDPSMLSLGKAGIFIKYRSIINTISKNKNKIQKLYNERRQPSQTFRNPNGFFAVPFSFPAKSGQIPAGKNWQISISLWVINSEKRAVSKPVLCIVLVSVSVAINNRNWKYLGWLQYPLLSLAIQRCVSTQTFLKQFICIRACIRQDEIFKISFICLLSCTPGDAQTVCWRSTSIKPILNRSAFTCSGEQLIQNSWGKC